MNVATFLAGFGRMSFWLLLLVLLALFTGLFGLGLLASAVELIALFGLAFIVLYVVAYLVSAVAAAGGTVAINVLSLLLLIGVILGVPIAVLAFAAAATTPAFVAAVMAGLLGAAAVAGVLVLLNLPNIVLVGISYFGATAALPPISNTMTPTAGEIGWRSHLAGINTAMNFWLAAAVYGMLFASFVPGPAALGLTVTAVLVLTLVNVLCVDSARNTAYKNLLGVSALFLPMSWFVNGLGLLLFAISLCLHVIGLIPFFSILRIGSISLTGGTGAIVMTGGLCANLNPIHTAYNMGNFIFIDSAFTSLPAATTTLHEDGHHLSLAAFGSNFHFMGWIDEMFAGGGASAYSELLAEGNIPGNSGAPALDVWNA